MILCDILTKHLVSTSSFNHDTIAFEVTSTLVDAYQIQFCFDRLNWDSNLQLINNCLDHQVNSVIRSDLEFDWCISKRVITNRIYFLFCHSFQVWITKSHWRGTVYTHTIHVYGPRRTLLNSCNWFLFIWIRLLHKILAIIFIFLHHSLLSFDFLINS